MAMIETVYHSIDNPGDLGGEVVLEITGLPDKAKEFISDTQFYISAFQQPNAQDKEFAERLAREYEAAFKNTAKVVSEKLRRAAQDIENMDSDSVSAITRDSGWSDYVCSQFAVVNQDDDCCLRPNDLHVGLGFKNLDEDKIHEIMFAIEPKVATLSRTSGRRRCFSRSKNVYFRTPSCRTVKAVVVPEENCDVSIRLSRDGVTPSSCNNGGKGGVEFLVKSGGRGEWTLRVTRNISGCFRLSSKWRLK